MNADEKSATDSSSDELLVAEIADEFLDRIESGSQPEVEEYVRRYPQIAEVLQQVLPVLQMVHHGSLECESGPSEPRADACVPNHALGDFRIHREIGRGGMGVVYEAEQLSLGRKVALKVLPFAAMLDSRQLQRFKNEAQVAAQLHHTNIVPVFAVGCDRGVHYYAMQLVNGYTLARIIHELRSLSGMETEGIRGGHRESHDLARDLSSGQSVAFLEQPEDMNSHPLPRAQGWGESILTALSSGTSTRSAAYFRSVAGLAIQATDALEHSHSQGIIHRDIKPSNLLVDSGGTLWITDFGLAHFRTGAGMTLTMQGDLLGTVRYMSPEQALGMHTTLDHRTDIYSLGVTLYELLTLEPAFIGQNRQQLIRMIEEQEPPRPGRLNDAVPSDLETIILKAISKEPASRYATALEFGQDLRRFLQDKPITAKRPTIIDRARKWGRRHRTFVAASFVVLAVSVIALLISTLAISYQYRQTHAALSEAQLHRRKAKANFDLALDAIDDILLEGDTESSTGLRKTFSLLDTISDGDARMADHSGTLIKCYTTLALSLRGNPRSDIDRSYLLAQGVVEDLEHLQGERPEYKLTLAWIHKDLGLVLRKLGEADRASYHYDRAMNLLDELVELSPEEHSYYAGLAESQSFLASVNVGSSEPDLLGKAFENIASAVELKPEEPAYHTTLVRLAGRIGTEDSYDRAISILEDCLDRVPQCRYELVLLYSGLGSLLNDLGQFEESQEAHRQAEYYWQDLASRDLPLGFAFGTPRNLGPMVNSTSDDSCPCISADGRSLFFESDRSGGLGGNDLWVVTRKDTNSPWGKPANLVAINSLAMDASPCLSHDGLSLYFFSTRPGGYGRADIWVARRTDLSQPWGTPANLGQPVNSDASDGAPRVSFDGTTLCFASDRGGGFGNHDLWVAKRTKDGGWGSPENLGSVVNSPSIESFPWISDDGLLLFFHSNRPGGFGHYDIWMTRRETRESEWQEPLNVGPIANSSYADVCPCISTGMSSLYFCDFAGRTARPGGQGGSDIWESRMVFLPMQEGVGQ